MDTILANVKPSWHSLFDHDELEIIMKIVGDNITPSRNNILEAFKYFEAYETKVVILGQDPYPTPGDAMGLSFSTNGKIPPSLMNIYKACINCGCMKQMPTSGDLRPWAAQGVLMLNCALTTVPGKTKSHTKLWKTWIQDFLTKLAAYNEKIIFVCWGADAINIMDGIVKRDRMLYCQHPSPMANTSLMPHLRFDVICTHFKTLQDKFGINWELASSSTH